MAVALQLYVPMLTAVVLHDCFVIVSSPAADCHVFESRHNDTYSAEMLMGGAYASPSMQCFANFWMLVSTSTQLKRPDAHLSVVHFAGGP